MTALNAPTLPPASSPAPAAAPRARGAARRKPTTLAAHGEPMVWLLGAGLVLSLALIVGVLGMIAVQGSATFWPRPVDRLTLASGEVVLGMPVRREHAASPSGGSPEPGVAPAWHTLYRVGNKDLGQDAFRWIDDAQITARDRPADVVVLEREAWGPWIGTPSRLIERRERTLGAAEQTLAEQASAERASAEPGVTTEVLSTLPDGARRVREQRVLAAGAGDVIAAVGAAHTHARALRARAETVTRTELGRINRRMESQRLAVREAELRASHDAAAPPPMLTRAGFVACGACVVAGIVAWWRWAGDGPARRRSWRRSAARVAAGCVVAGGLLAMSLEHPWRAAPIESPGTPQRLDELRTAAKEASDRLQGEYDRVLAQVRRLETDAGVTRLEVIDARTGRFAPLSQSSPDEPLMLADVVRIVRPNAMSWADRFGVYLSRWGEYLTAPPRDANNEGGVFPVIFGTVLMTMMLSIVVVPLGVIAALYLREYAPQGAVVSALRIAVNNLAGVPSIVYGVFGYGFLCLTVGRFADGGPEQPAARPAWWTAVAAAALCLVVAAALSKLGQSERDARRARWYARGLALAWLGAVGLAAYVLASTPYFHGFFGAKLPNPTFGKGGVLWASLTLALLTLPVVIVATEEAIAAVPRSVREGSYGCGASKWQTVRRIVLPQALPGIMTGAILAMARGAGEVAPLMLVGAVKIAPELPVSGEAPFLHPERSFMHLGFHIFDLGFQSRDADAARPLVWTTTLLLVVIVLALNLAAISARARLRARVVTSAV